MTLDMHTYNEEENKALSSLGNRIIEANCPVTFQLSGYPSSVSSNDQLWRYVDAMHELGEEKCFEKELKGLTDKEFSLFKKISEVVFQLTKNLYCKPIIPKGALLRAFVALRYIRCIADPKDTTILEIGPGSGYLGALLAIEGYRYIATDIAQGFYIHQNILWSHLFGDRLLELASIKMSMNDIDELDSGSILHVPWWKYSSECPERFGVPVDLVVSNHAMCEMHRSAFGYNLNIAHHWLSRSETPKIFLVEGAGADRIRKYDEMCYGFEKADFMSVAKHSTTEFFTPKRYADNFCKDDQTNNPSTATNDMYSQTNINPSSLKPTSKSKFAEIIRLLKNSKATLSADGGGKDFLTKVHSYLLGTTIHIEKEQTNKDGIPQNELFQNWFEENIHKELRGIENHKKISFEEMRDFQYKLIGGNDIYTEDEKFLRFAYGTKDWS